MNKKKGEFMNKNKTVGGLKFFERGCVSTLCTKIHFFHISFKTKGVKKGMIKCMKEGTESFNEVCEYLS